MVIDVPFGSMFTPSERFVLLNLLRREVARLEDQGLRYDYDFSSSISVLQDLVRKIDPEST